MLGGCHTRDTAGGGLPQPARPCEACRSSPPHPAVSVHRWHPTDSPSAPSLLQVLAYERGESLVVAGVELGPGDIKVLRDFKAPEGSKPGGWAVCGCGKAAVALPGRKPGEHALSIQPGGCAPAPQAICSPTTPCCLAACRGGDGCQHHFTATCARPPPCHAPMHLPQMADAPCPAFPSALLQRTWMPAGTGRCWR